MPDRICDHEDTNLLVSHSLERNPVTVDSTLLNTANGRIEEPEVNVDSAKETG